MDEHLKGGLNVIKYWLSHLDNPYVKTIEELKVAQYLELQNNRLDKIPSQIEYLDELTYLSLSHNNLKSLPVELSNLTKLTQLSLDNNVNLMNVDAIYQLTDLISLDLSHNAFATSFLYNICTNLINLRFLSLIGCGLKQLPDVFSNLKQLTRLNLSQNNFTIFPPQLYNLVNLTDLNLNYNKLTSIPKEIGNLIKLSTFNIRNNNITTLPPQIGKLAFTFFDSNKEDLIQIYKQYRRTYLLNARKYIKENKTTLEGINKIYYTYEIMCQDLNLYFGHDELVIMAEELNIPHTNWLSKKDLCTSVGAHLLIVKQGVMHPIKE